MNAGDGTLVGMSVLPKGIAPDASDEDNEEEDTGDSTSAQEGPWLFTLTKKVSVNDQIIDCSTLA